MHFFKKGICIMMTAVLFGGCAKPSEEEKVLTEDKNLEEKQEVLAYEADPNDFSLNIKWKDRFIPVSLPSGEHKAENIKEEDGVMKWEYPEESLAVTLTPHAGYLDVEIESTTEEDHNFSWPYVSGETYYMPFGEGKRIPGDDAVWSSHLKGQIYSAVEQLSMPFFSSAGDDYAVTYIMENPVRSSLVFSEGDQIDFSVLQEYREIDESKVNRLRIYVTDKDPVNSAKVYRQYKIEQNQFVTLKEKAEQNPNVEKLFGAPHIYLWGDFVISPDDINWADFRNSLKGPVMEYILSYLDGSEYKDEVTQTLDEISTQDYASLYQKNIICRFLTEVLMDDDFYQQDHLPAEGSQIDAYLKKGKENLDQSELIQLNKYALAENMPGVFKSVKTWMDASTVDILNGMKEAGIDHAWIGLNSWEQAFSKPELAGTAIDNGYLLASYDSYHSIHEPGKEQWITAAFEDTDLYENAAVQKKDGEMEEGFQGVGRKLNPTLSMPAVKERMEKIIGTNISIMVYRL